MSDDGDTRSAVDGGAEPTSMGVEAEPTSTRDGAEMASGEQAESVDFEDLSLPQRVFVAAVQNPTRGVFVLALFAFAFSFYIAFWMVFPRVAAFLSVIAVVIAAVSFGIYFGVKRL